MAAKNTRALAALPPDSTTPATTPDLVDINISATPIKALRVNLVGVVYSVKPPKGSLAMALAKQMQKSGAHADDDDFDTDRVMRPLLDYLQLAVGKAEAKKIQARLEDPDDALDLPHIMELLQKLTEATTGNPTM